MSYTSDNIEVLTGLEAIRKRPGMYIGDLGRLGVARLIQCAVDVLAALSVNRDHHPRYADHAFLDVSVDGRQVEVSINYMRGECPDIADRCRSLIENRENMRPDAFALNQLVNAVAPIAVLSALTTELSIFSSEIGAVIGIPKGIEPELQKNAFARVSFHIGDEFDIDGLTTDFLEGFVEGARHVQALLVRNISVN